MIKTALKHCIYELCINIWFEQVVINFSNVIKDSKHDLISRILKASRIVSMGSRQGRNRIIKRYARTPGKSTLVGMLPGDIKVYRDTHAVEGQDVYRPGQGWGSYEQ